MHEVIGFKRAKLEDVNFLIALRNATMNEHLVKAGIMVTDEQHRLRVREFFNDSQLILKNERPIGLIKVGVTAQSLHIRQFQILPIHQGLGIGTRVINAIKKKAVALNLPITLNVLVSNPAKKLYQRHGFIIEDCSEIECQMRWRQTTANNRH